MQLFTVSKRPFTCETSCPCYPSQNPLFLDVLYIFYKHLGHKDNIWHLACLYEHPYPNRNTNKNVNKR